MDSLVHRSHWTRPELLIAFKLYCEMPFGKMHSRNPMIVRIAGDIRRTPSSLAMKLTNIASLDPTIRGSGRKGLTGASRADKAMWEEMTSNWDQFFLTSEAALKEVETRALASSAPTDENKESISYAGFSKKIEAFQRIGQASFRKAVLSSYNAKCCISGISLKRLLVASHIVPWKTDVENRLNPQNGLCLSVLHDRAFDCGLISLDDKFCLVISDEVRHAADAMVKTTILDFEGKQITLPDKFFPKAEFLDFHRRFVFKDGKAEC